MGWLEAPGSISSRSMTALALISTVMRSGAPLQADWPDIVGTTTVDESMTTALVRDVNTNVAPPGTTTPTNLTAFNHKLYFTETDGTGTGQHGLELWSTDGTFDRDYFGAGYICRYFQQQSLQSDRFQR